MKQFFIILPILLIFSTTCLNPTRDNDFDPDNPDKAYLAGHTYDFENSPLKGTEIKLLEESTILDETTSDNNGYFKFNSIDPGIYKIIATFEYYRPVEFYPESLPAGCQIDNFDIRFEEIIFDFDNESVGTQEPTGFNIELGNWEISEDQSDYHSTPNVYSGSTMNGPGLTLFEKGLDDFWFEGKIKVLTGSGGEWNAGYIFRYIDPLNYYVLQINQGELKFMKVKNNNTQPLKIIDSLNFTPETWYVLGAEFKGNHIKILLDYNTLFELNDDAFSYGAVGLWLFNLQGMVSASFDDINIWP